MLPRHGIIKFTAAWCGPCKRIQAPLKAAAEELRLELKEVDVDDEPQTMESFQVHSMPTIVFLLDGREVKDLRVIGANMEGIRAHMKLHRQAIDEWTDGTSQISVPCSADAIVTCRKTTSP